MSPNLGVFVTVFFTSMIHQFAYAHDFYDNLVSPLTKEYCCGNMDCHPVDLCVTSDGKEGLQIRADLCVGIRREVVLPMISPDGRAHVCLEAFSFHGDLNYNTGNNSVQKCVILPGNS